MKVFVNNKCLVSNIMVERAFYFIKLKFLLSNQQHHKKNIFDF